MNREAAGRETRLHVVVGIIRGADDRLLIQQRRPGTPKAGKWEFPGGKVEAGESPRGALIRELGEELGIVVTSCAPLTTITHDYPHARVLLDTWVVNGFDGEAIGREGQRIVWEPVSLISQYDVLEAVPPLLAAIAEC